MVPSLIRSGRLMLVMALFVAVVASWEIDSRHGFHPASPIIKLLSWNTTKNNFNYWVKISETIVLHGLRVWEFGLGVNEKLSIEEWKWSWSSWAFVLILNSELKPLCSPFFAIGRKVSVVMLEVALAASWINQGHISELIRHSRGAKGGAKDIPFFRFHASFAPYFHSSPYDKF